MNTNYGERPGLEPQPRTMSAEPKPRATYRGGPGAWRGAIVVGRAVVWQCPHAHRNRDFNGLAHTSATCCASLALESATNPDNLRSKLDWARRYARIPSDVALMEWAALLADEVRAALASAAERGAK